jgi:hypothetical protein
LLVVCTLAVPGALAQPADSDGDGVPDSIDNCIEAANPDQLDADRDGHGNACDGDLDNSGFVNSIDFSIFKTRLLTDDPDADLDGSGFVNSIDFSKFKLLLLKPPGPSAVPAPELRVIGRLLIFAPELASESPSVRLPQAQVWLEDLLAGERVDESQTRLDGNFELIALQKSRHRVCWRVENLTEGCGPTFSVGSLTTTYVGDLLAQPLGGYVYGLNRSKNDRPCWLHDPFFGANLVNPIHLLDAKGDKVPPAAVANVAGEYVIGLPPGGPYQVQTECEDIVRTTAGFVGGGGGTRIDFALDNTTPQIVEIAAFRGSLGIKRADPGEVITARVVARDADNDPLEYRWRLLDGAGNLASDNLDTTDWTVPSTPGIYQAFVIVSDGHGGYASDTLNVHVTDANLDFSGVVIDEITRLPVKDATVTVTDVETTSDQNGWFQMKVPESTGTQRYALNIHHPQYATYSRILDKLSRGNTYELIRAQVTVLDPTLPIDVTDNESSGPCGRRDAAGQKCVCDGRGRLHVPANALVYPDQSLPAGPVTLSMATLNPQRRSIPGDYRAIDAVGSFEELISFGALHVEFRDQLGNLLNLRTGMEATIELPVCETLGELAADNVNIPLWTYDEKTGFWMEEGKATLAGSIYSGNVAHFSTINTDIADNVADATCLRVEFGASFDSWAGLRLRVYVSYNGTESKVKETAIDADQYHAIFRIPYADPPAVPATTVRMEVRGTVGGAERVLLDEIIQTDLLPQMDPSGGLWPDYPYTECNDPIVLEVDGNDLPDYGDINSTGRPAFLTGPYGNYLPDNGEQVATDYYDQIDPTDSKTTLGGWWSENGFNGTTGAGGTQVSYLNHNDLGFGRDMHCLGDADDYACYVTNYGLPDQNPQNADDAEDNNPATRGATVTMEYHRALGAYAVSFYAFGGGVDTSPRIKFADLDGLGPKPIPHLCLICHGGSYNEVSNEANGAKFREFDLPTFRYSDNRTFEFGGGDLNNTELSNFKTINLEVADINTAGGTPNKIATLVDGWYPGAPVAPVLPPAPSSWADNGGTPIDEEAVYHTSYAIACRACHIARDDIVDTYASFASFADNVACGIPKVMPNSFITYKNFWSNLAAVTLLEEATGIGVGNCP